MSSCRGGCRYEPKWDGFRAMALVDAYRGVHLASRRLARFNDAFPEIALAVHDQLPPETVVDGEIVRWDPDGRLDFAALQRRHVAGRRRAKLGRTEPCHLVVFDVLESRGVDLRDRPLRERRRVLEDLLGAAAPTALVVASPHTDDPAEARVWFDALLALGIEGLVVKGADDPYRPGLRTSWKKVKHRATTEAIIGGITGALADPETLILGRYTGSGRLRVVARSTPLPRTWPARVSVASSSSPLAAT
ncbi:hypothetical protein [Thermomonospora umbrina]|uniref:ATP dependent DNA ligase-like protein n=1 Tax=Thermomonospora umbrina TaxID=111806 RepID=A0A3D9SXH9_9ACTN|nr:hypothetical protein [Thermomonospora umbrina]REF00660.1 ATP dependent DNA ligase-like protein [Thermomonospora umbrina]